MKLQLEQVRTDMLRAEEREVDLRIPDKAPHACPDREVFAVEEDLGELLSLILGMKDDAEAWLRQAHGAVARGEGYASRAAYAAWQDRLTWAKRTHQRAMMVKGVWTREAKGRRSKQPVTSTPTGERIDLGALVIAAAFKYRFHRTKENAAALDAALENIAIASERWRNFRDDLR